MSWEFEKMSLVLWSRVKANLQDIGERHTTWRDGSSVLSSGLRGGLVRSGRRKWGSQRRAFRILFVATTSAIVLCLSLHSGRDNWTGAGRTGREEGDEKQREEAEQNETCLKTPGASAHSSRRRGRCFLVTLNCSAKLFELEMQVDLFETAC